MSGPEEQQFISNVKRALGNPGREAQRRAALFGRTDPDRLDSIVARIQARSNDQRRQLLETLIETAKPLNLSVAPVGNEAEAAALIAKLIAEKTPEWGGEKRVAVWRHPLIEKLNLPGLLADQQTPVLPSTAEDHQAVRQQIIDSFVGVTSADFCVAETATLVMRTRPDQARATSLLPAIHIAVIYLDQVIASLAELYAVLTEAVAENPDGLSNCMTLITGPSKTADIELVMVHGAHGPREVHIIVITGQ